MGFYRIVFAALMASSLVACASYLPLSFTAPTIPFDRQAAGDVKTIGVLTPYVPRQPSLYIAANPRQRIAPHNNLSDAFVDILFGNIFHANTNGRELDTALVGQQFSAHDICITEVTARLQDLGYSVVLIPVERSKADFLTTYPVNQAHKIDAYLDIVLTYGYMAADRGFPFRPSAHVRTRLVKPSEGRNLMQDVVAYNLVDSGRYASEITIPPDPAYAFASYNGLIGDPARAAQGLQVAITQSVKPIGQLLK